MTDEQEYVLGEDVTKAATARSRSGTAVLSVRLTADELAAIEAVARESGKTLSQVVREAIRDCIQMVRSSQPDITVSSEGFTSTTGAVRPISTGMFAEVQRGELAPV